MYWKSSYTTLGQKVYRYFDNFSDFLFFTSKKLNWNNCGHKSSLDQQAFSLPFLQFNNFYLLAWKLEQFYFCNLTLGVQEKEIILFHEHFFLLILTYMYLFLTIYFDSTFTVRFPRPALHTIASLLCFLLLKKKIKSKHCVHQLASAIIIYTKKMGE